MLSSARRGWTAERVRSQDGFISGNTVTAPLALNPSVRVCP